MERDEYGFPIIRCENAGEFLRELDEMNPRWHDGTWIFRGQNDVSWSLLPKAMREGNLVYQYVEDNFKEVYETLLPQREELVSRLYEKNKRHFVNVIRKFFPLELNQLPTPEDYYRNNVATTLHSTCERFIAYLFERHADSSNLELPFDRFPTPWNAPVLLSRRLLEQKLTGIDETWRNEHMRVIYALAQHHGLPTRLLDWTYRPLAAAFFAVHKENPGTHISDRDGGGLKEKTPEPMVVWAVQQEALGGVGLQVVRHLRRQIGFLGAQEGVFAYDLLANERRKIFGKWVPFESLFPPLAAEGKVYKFTLPHSERECLIDLLNKKKISKARLMPSFDNVAEEIAYNFNGLMKEYS